MFEIAINILIGVVIGWYLKDIDWKKSKQKFKEWLDNQDSKPVV